MAIAKAAFPSVLVRRDRGFALQITARPNQEAEIMCSGPAYDDWAQSIAKLKEQWTQFMSETFFAIAEEEMKLRREEIKRRIRSFN